MTKLGGTDFGDGYVELLVRSAEPPREHRYENRNNNNNRFNVELAIEFMYHKYKLAYIYHCYLLCKFIVRLLIFHLSRARRRATSKVTLT